MSNPVPALLVLALSMTAASAAIADDGCADLRQAFGGEHLRAAGRFDYRLRVEDGQGRLIRDARYRLQLQDGRLQVDDLLDGSRSAWDGEAALRVDATGQLWWLDDAARDALGAHVRSHFLHLLRAEGTRCVAGGDGWIRLQPAAGEAFDVRTDPAHGRIVENRFDSGSQARELDYREIDGLWWPQAFAVTRADGSQVAGRFDELATALTDAEWGWSLPQAPATAVADSAKAALRIAPGLVSTPANEYNLSEDAAATRRVFARSATGFAAAQIFVAEREGQGWSEPRPAPFSDSRYRDSDPWLTPEGRWLYFISDRPAAARGSDRHDLDLWRVAIGADGGWGAPEHLGAEVNSAQEELGPELHGGRLYFNSARPGGPARLSLYSAPQREDGGFAAAEPLPAPFNDGELQGDLTLSPDGRLALFWSQRAGSAGADLYRVRRSGAGWEAQAQRLPAPISSAGFDFTPAFSADGRELRFASDRRLRGMVEQGPGAGGQADLYAVSTDLLSEPSVR